MLIVKGYNYKTITGMEELRKGLDLIISLYFTLAATALGASSVTWEEEKGQKKERKGGEVIFYG